MKEPIILVKDSYLTSLREKYMSDPDIIPPGGTTKQEWVDQMVSQMERQNRNNSRAYSLLTPTASDTAEGGGSDMYVQINRIKKASRMLAKSTEEEDYMQAIKLAMERHADEYSFLKAAEDEPRKWKIVHRYQIQGTRPQEELDAGKRPKTARSFIVVDSPTLDAPITLTRNVSKGHSVNKEGEPSNQSWFPVYGHHNLWGHGGSTLPKITVAHVKALEAHIRGNPEYASENPDGELVGNLEGVPTTDEFIEENFKDRNIFPRDGKGNIRHTSDNNTKGVGPFGVRAQTTPDGDERPVFDAWMEHVKSIARALIIRDPETGQISNTDEIQRTKSGKFEKAIQGIPKSSPLYGAIHDIHHSSLGEPSGQRVSTFNYPSFETMNKINPDARKQEVVNGKKQWEVVDGNRVKKMVPVPDEEQEKSMKPIKRSSPEELIGSKYPEGSAIREALLPLMRVIHDINENSDIENSIVWTENDNTGDGNAVRHQINLQDISTAVDKTNAVHLDAINENVSDPARAAAALLNTEEFQALLQSPNASANVIPKNTDGTSLSGVLQHIGTHDAPQSMHQILSNHIMGESAPSAAIDTTQEEDDLLAAENNAAYSAEISQVLNPDTNKLEESPLSKQLNTVLDFDGSPLSRADYNNLSPLRKEIAINTIRRLSTSSETERDFSDGLSILAEDMKNLTPLELSQHHSYPTDIKNINDKRGIKPPVKAAPKTEQPVQPNKETSEATVEEGGLNAAEEMALGHLNEITGGAVDNLPPETQRDVAQAVVSIQRNANKIITDLPDNADEADKADAERKSRNSLGAQLDVLAQSVKSGNIKSIDEDVNQFRGTRENYERTIAGTADQSGARGTDRGGAREPVVSETEGDARESGDAKGADQEGSDQNVVGGPDGGDVSTEEPVVSTGSGRLKTTVNGVDIDYVDTEGEGVTRDYVSEGSVQPDQGRKESTRDDISGRMPAIGYFDPTTDAAGRPLSKEAADALRKKFTDSEGNPVQFTHVAIGKGRDYKVQGFYKHPETGKWMPMDGLRNTVGGAGDGQAFGDDETVTLGDLEPTIDSRAYEDNDGYGTDELRSIAEHLDSVNYGAGLDLDAMKKMSSDSHVNAYLGTQAALDIRRHNYNIRSEFMKNKDHSRGLAYQKDGGLSDQEQQRLDELRPKVLETVDASEEEQEEFKRLYYDPRNQWYIKSPDGLEQGLGPEWKPDALPSPRSINSNAVHRAGWNGFDQNVFSDDEIKKFFTEIGDADTFDKNILGDSGLHLQTVRTPKEEWDAGFIRVQSHQGPIVAHKRDENTHLPIGDPVEEDVVQSSISTTKDDTPQQQQQDQQSESTVREKYGITPPISSGGRVITTVTLDDGTVQPFYRRTGMGNAGQEEGGASRGEWVPFDGFTHHGWFDKHNYTTDEGGNPLDPMDPRLRYGLGEKGERFKAISAELTDAYENGDLFENQNDIISERTDKAGLQVTDNDISKDGKRENPEIFGELNKHLADHGADAAAYKLEHWGKVGGGYIVGSRPAAGGAATIDETLTDTTADGSIPSAARQEQQLPEGHDDRVARANAGRDQQNIQVDYIDGKPYTVSPSGRYMPMSGEPEWKTKEGETEEEAGAGGYVPPIKDNGEQPRLFGDDDDDEQPKVETRTPTTDWEKYKAKHEGFVEDKKNPGTWERQEGADNRLKAVYEHENEGDPHGMYSYDEFLEDEESDFDSKGFKKKMSGRFAKVHNTREENKKIDERTDPTVLRSFRDRIRRQPELHQVIQDHVADHVKRYDGRKVPDTDYKTFGEYVRHISQLPAEERKQILDKHHEEVDKRSAEGEKVEQEQQDASTKDAWATESQRIQQEMADFPPILDANGKIAPQYDNTAALHYFRHLNKIVFHDTRKNLKEAGVDTSHIKDMSGLMAALGDGQKMPEELGKLIKSSFTEINKVMTPRQKRDLAEEMETVDDYMGDRHKKQIAADNDTARNNQADYEKRLDEVRGKGKYHPIFAGTSKENYRGKDGKIIPLYSDPDDMQKKDDEDARFREEGSLGPEEPTERAKRRVSQGHPPTESPGEGYAYHPESGQWVDRERFDAYTAHFDEHLKPGQTASFSPHSTLHTDHIGKDEEGVRSVVLQAHEPLAVRSTGASDYISVTKNARGQLIWSPVKPPEQNKHGFISPDATHHDTGNAELDERLNNAHAIGQIKGAYHAQDHEEGSRGDHARHGMQENVVRHHNLGGRAAPSNVVPVGNEINELFQPEHWDNMSRKILNFTRNHGGSLAKKLLPIDFVDPSEEDMERLRQGQQTIDDAKQKVGEATQKIVDPIKEATGLHTGSDIARLFYDPRAQPKLYRRLLLGASKKDEALGKPTSGLLGAAKKLSARVVSPIAEAAKDEKLKGEAALGRTAEKVGDKIRGGLYDGNEKVNKVTSAIAEKTGKVIDRTKKDASQVGQDIASAGMATVDEEGSPVAPSEGTRRRLGDRPSTPAEAPEGETEAEAAKRLTPDENALHPETGEKMTRTERRAAGRAAAKEARRQAPKQELRPTPPPPPPTTAELDLPDVEDVLSTPKGRGTMPTTPETRPERRRRKRDEEKQAQMQATNERLAAISEGQNQRQQAADQNVGSALDSRHSSNPDAGGEGHGTKVRNYFSRVLGRRSQGQSSSPVPTITPVTPPDTTKPGVPQAGGEQSQTTEGKVGRTPQATKPRPARTDFQT
jgi:hypothetical protein